MKALSFITLALAAIVLAVQGEKMTIEGRSALDTKLNVDYVKVEVDDTETVGDLGKKLCEKLEGKIPDRVVVKDIIIEKDYYYYYQDSSQKLYFSDIKDGHRVMVTCQY